MLRFIKTPCHHRCVTRWKKDAKEFHVSLSANNNRDGSQSMTCRVPKPILEILGDPNGLKFLIKNRSIVVTAGEK